MIYRLACLSVVALLTACGDSAPGPLGGTWQATAPLPMNATFRDGEMESMGMIEKVGYKVDGRSVIVTMKGGMMKGTAVRYELRDPRTAVAMGVTYRKVQ